MMNLFSEFNKVSKEEWTQKLLKDLKGQPESLLHFSDPIEEISYSSYYHNEDNIERSSPGNLPYTRGVIKPLNDWKNCYYIHISNEKSDNAKALGALMAGSDMLWIKHSGETINWSDALADIQTEYIQLVIETDQPEDISMLSKSGMKNVSYAFDFFNYGSNDLDTVSELFKSEQYPFMLVDAMKIQQAGGNISQQIAFALNIGHEYLVLLMNRGFSIDQASACIQFRFGIGNDYFLESLKFRTFRTLWANVIAAYQPAHKCSHNATVHAFTTHVNKSLNDPYTNLLRQTTEVMSAVNGDVNSVCVLPYDLYSISGASDLSTRMALNLTNILKEESYFDKVCDVLGGSYSMENIMDKLIESSWGKFQELEEKKGLFEENTKSSFFKEVNETRTKRVTRTVSGEQTLIGVNKFENPDKSENGWRSIENYNGLSSVILEKELENSMA